MHHPTERGEQCVVVRERQKKEYVQESLILLQKV